MLRVTVELVPFGDESKKRKIGEMVIANDGSGDISTASYQAWIGADDHSGDPAMFSKLERHDRSKSVWELIKLLIDAARSGRHSPDEETDSVSQRLKNRLS